MFVVPLVPNFPRGTLWENLCGLIWRNTRAHTQSSTIHVITSSLFDVLYFFPFCVYLVTSLLDKQARSYIFVTKHFSPHKIRYVIITCFWLNVHNIMIVILMLIHNFICLNTSANLNRDVLKFYMNECHRNPIHTYCRSFVKFSSPPQVCLFMNVLVYIHVLILVYIISNTLILLYIHI